VSDLDLKGNIDIGTGSAVSNLNNLAQAAAAVQKAFDAGEISAAQYASAMAANSRAVNAANDSIGRSSVNLSKVMTEESRRRIAESKAEADNAKQTASQITASLKAQEAAQKQAVARNRAGTGNQATTGAATVNRNLSKALGFEDDPQTAQLKAMNDYYRQIEAADAKSAAQQIANAQRVADAKAAQNKQSLIQQQRDEAAVRKSELSAMRGSSQSAFELPDIGQLNQTRYALYDVSTTLGVLGAGLTAAGGAALTFGAQYESAFTQVERTSLPTAQAAQSLRTDLKDLSETIPVGFDQLSSIAALGAQMNIANDDLAQFADTTARYSAVTGVSTDQVATSFGALFELTNTGSGEMENLASSINFVGVRSVATDSEILSLAQNIGASTTQAGFLAEQTVGLAGALASLRIQPEQARGVILRLFSDFDKAVSENGTQLEKYSKTLNKTTEDTAALWNTDPEAFFDQLLKGLSTAEDLNGALRELGITETRESNVLQRLAGNYDTYANSMSDAAQAYQEGTFLGESYGKVADDVASRVQILVNSITNLLAKAGQSVFPILGPVLQVVTTIVQGIEAIPAPILGVLTTITLLAGGFALIVAGGAALVASGFAVRTALAGITQQGGATVGVMTGLRSTVTGLTAALGINSAAARVNGATIGSLIPGYRAQQAATVGLTTATLGSSAALGGAGVAARSFGTALLATPILNIVAALSILVPLAFSLKDALSESSQESARAGAALLSAGGGVESFRAALQKDTEAAGENADGLGRLTAKVTETQEEAAQASKAHGEYASALGQATGASDELYSASSSVTQGLKDQTLLVGENSRAWVANALYKQASQDPENDPLGQLFGDEKMRARYEQSGIDIRDAINAGLGKDGGVAGALEAQIADIRNKIASSGSDTMATDLLQLDSIVGPLREAAASADAMGGSLTTADAVASALGASTGVVADEMGEVEEKSTSAADSIGALFDTLGGAGTYAAAMDALRDSIDENGYAFDNLSAGGRANLSALGSALAEASTYGSTLGLSAEDSMAQAAISIGGDVSSVLSALQAISAANPTAYADLDISAVIAKYKQLQSLGVGAFGSASNIGVTAAADASNLNRLMAKRTQVQSQLSSAQASAAPKRAKANDSAAKKAAADAKKQADAIKTTAEYARDLGSAMKEAFDKRFGVQQSMDDITSKFQDLADRIKEAKDRMAALKADLASLQSDRSILEIQLKVATDYGDTTRADAINAQLGQNGIDQAAKQADLAKATAAASTELEGNTTAAIENRAAVLGLISAYQGQIEAFAATGASAQQISAYTRTLQGQFEQQLTQLGYNSAQVRAFSSTFDALTTAVNNVPTRKAVTVTADTSSAMGSLNAVGGKIGSLSGDLASLNAQIAAAQARVDKNTRAQAIQKDITALVGQYAAYNLGAPTALSVSQMAQLQGRIAFQQARLASGNYASGGLITGGQRPANRSLDNTMINAQFGEGVVNLKGMSFLGVDGLNAINNQQNPFPPQVVYVNSPSSNNSGTMEVSLSPIDRQLIAAGQAVTVTIPRTAVAGATNAANLDNSLRGANG